MKKHLVAGAATALSLLTFETSADSLAEALAAGTVKGNFNLRYEAVDQDNALDDASALTLRSRLSYTSGALNGFSVGIEFEDSRSVFGVDDYSVPPTGFKPGEYSVIADPDHTELDQGFIQYKSGGFTGKLGRQVIVYDGQRFVGHVGWRQDRQTFDAFKADYKSGDFTASYAYLDQRNRIFADDRDIDSSDHLLNASYKTGMGKLTAYAYLLEVDDVGDNSLDTVGASFKGKQKMDGTTLLYAIELASQESDAGGNSFDAMYSLIEVGAVVSGISAKVGMETLGSDDGSYGFSTPLATLHKFNGWADQFLGTPGVGLVDVYFTVLGKAGGGKWNVTYHDYSADEDQPGVDDLGSELNLSYGRKFGKHVNGGIKYAAYSAGDSGAGKVDTDKLWVWMGYSF